MIIHRQALLAWSVFLVAFVLLILLWTGQLDVQQPTIDGTVRGATIFLRIANFVLTTEILLVTSCVYGASVWYYIHKNSISTTHANLWWFYDGGSTLLPTLKSLISSKDASLQILATIASVIMIASYFLDVFYIQAIIYTDVEQCVIGNTTIDIMTSNASEYSYIIGYRRIYSMGSRIGLLPFDTTAYSSTYIVPALGNTTYLHNYTTIAYNASTFCEDAKPKVDNTSALIAQSFTGAYDSIDIVNGTKQVYIERMGSFQSDPLKNSSRVFYVSAYGLQNNTPDGMTSVKFGKYRATVARCRSTVTYSLYNNIYGWNHDVNFTSAEMMASDAEEAPYDMERVYTNTLTTERHNKVSEWLTNCKTTYNSTGFPMFQSNISLADYEKKLTMVMIQYLKGGGLNGTTITPGLYCMPPAHQSNVAKWYKVLFSCVQGVIFVILILYTFFLARLEQVENNTETLFKSNSISL